MPLNEAHDKSLGYYGTIGGHNSWRGLQDFLGGINIDGDTAGQTLSDLVGVTEHYTPKKDADGYADSGLSWSGNNASIAGVVGVGGSSNASYGVLSNTLPMAVIRTANDTTDTSVFVTGRGTAAGNTGILYSTGGGSNNVTALGIKIGSTEVADFSSGLVAVTGAISATTGITVATGQDVLDAHDNDTYTATLTCGTSGTITLNASNNTLHHFRIGDMCCVHGYLSVSSVSSPTGTLTLNLPLTSASLQEGAETGTGIILIDGAVSLNVNQFGILTGTSSANATIYEAATASLASASADQIQASTGIYLMLWYPVA